MSDSVEVVASDDTPRPTFLGRLPDLPKLPAVKHLVDELRRRGFTDAGANAVARAQTDPSAFRRRLPDPVPQRVDGGTIYVVYAELWTHAVAPMPTNWRLSEDYTYPFGGAVARTPLSKPTAQIGDAPERRLLVKDPDAVVAALDHEVLDLLEDNDLRESIMREGVRDHIFTSALTIEHVDDEPVTLLVADDGSSRITSCLSLLDTPVRDVVYRYAVDQRALRARIGRDLQLADADIDDLTGDDIARLAALIVPAAVVVDFKADDGSRVDIARAIEYRVGNIHVDPPKAWSETSKLDSQLSAALDACVERGRLNEEKRAYLEGLSTPDEAEAAGLSRFADDRAITLFEFFVPQANARVIHAGIRGLMAASAMRPHRRNRVELAVEASIRSFRHEADQNADRARRTLNDVFSRLASRNPHFVAGKLPEDLRDEALAELVDDSQGNATDQLIAQAAFWLARYNCVRPTSGGQHQGSSATDARWPGQLLRDVVKDDRGVHQLYQAIVDGRDGSRPRAVREDGRPISTARNAFRYVDDAFLRETWPVTVAPGGADPDGTAGPGVPVSTTPENELNRRREDVRSAVLEFERCVEALKGPTDADTGRPLVSIRGISSVFITEMKGILDDSITDLGAYGWVWNQRNPEGPRDDVSDDEAEADHPA